MAATHATNLSIEKCFWSEGSRYAGQLRRRWTCAANNTVTSGPSNEEPNDQDEGDVDYYDEDDVEDREWVEGDRGSINRSNSPNKRSGVSINNTINTENVKY